MNVLICADAQPQIGTGHLRRMLTLAEALLTFPDVTVTIQTSALGAKIMRDSNLSVRIRIAPCDPEGVKKTLREKSYQAVILDNYHWHASLETPLRQDVPCICVVDDLADRPHDADILLDQNAHHTAANYDGLLSETCLRLVGAKWCLLSAPFRTNSVRTHDPLSMGAEAPVFISLGGGDPNGDLVPIIQVILSQTNLSMTIATGSHINDANTLQALSKAHPNRIELVFDSARVADQMLRSKFAVASGGTMTWERAALGLPSLCLIVADNQAESTNWLAAQQIHAAFDLRGDWQPNALAEAIDALAADSRRRMVYARNSRKLIDGDGAVRTASALLNSLNS